MKHSRREHDAAADHPHAPGIEPDVGDDGLDVLAERLEAASSTVGRRITAACGSGSRCLTAPQHHLLRLLHVPGGRRSSELAEILGVQPSAVTAIVDRLVERGLVERERDSDDRRVVWIRVTEAGEHEYGEAREAVRGYMRSLLQSLDPADVQTLVGIMERLAEVASDATSRGQGASTPRGTTE